MAGLEVEERHAVAPPFTGVVVARVREVRKHPNADKLTVCEVDIGAARAAVDRLWCAECRAPVSWCRVRCRAPSCPAA